MNPSRVFAAIGLAVALGASSLGAHHAFSAEFDINKPVSLEGVLTKSEFMNPHAWLYIDVKDKDGNVANWAVEMGPPSALLRRGWRKSSMKYGTVLKVEGYAAKNGKEFANASNITLPDGTKIFVGSDEPKY